MTKPNRKFLISNIFITILLGIICSVLFLTILAPYYHNFLPVALFLAFVINLIVYAIGSRNNSKNKHPMLVIIYSFAIKFFSYVALILTYIFLESEPGNRIVIILFIFLFYLAFTFIEVRALVKHTKTQV